MPSYPQQLHIGVLTHAGRNLRSVKSIGSVLSDDALRVCCVSVLNVIFSNIFLKEKTNPLDFGHDC